MQKRLLSLIVGIVLLSAPLPAFSATQEGIAAIVNDTVITMTDIRDRTELYMSGSREALPPEQRRRMEQQVLNRLIDEALQLQEAKKLGISVAEEDVTAGFADLSRQNGITPPEFKKRLSAAGVRIDSLYAQIRADIAWGQVVRRRLRPQVNISESEIDLTLKQIAHGSGKTQYHVAEIFLSVPDPAKEKDARNEADKLVGQLTKGASFSDMAREFSQAPGAANGGELGWVQEGQMAPELDKALAKMKPNQISPPIRSAKGYHILFLRELRQNAGPLPGMDAGAGAQVSLKQILIPATDKDPDSVITAKMARARSLKGEIKSCEAMSARTKDFPASGTGDLGKGPEGSLPEPLRDIVQKLKVGELSEPIRSSEGIAVIMVCAREEASAAAQKPGSGKDETSREQVANKLGMQRLGQMADRYLRDLRATAFIDRRI